MLCIRKSAIYLMRFTKMAYQTVNWRNVKMLFLLAVGDVLWAGAWSCEKKREHLIVA